MAVGYVASASSGSQASVASFNIGTLGTGARAGVVFLLNHTTNADIFTGVTWNGVAMTRLYSAADTNTEPAFVVAYFLDNVTNGVITVSRTNNTNVTVGYAASISAAGPTYVSQVVTEGGGGTVNTNADSSEAGTTGSGENAIDDGSPGTSSMRFAAFYTGAATPLSAGTNSTSLQTLDSTSFGSTFVRETTAGQGSRNVGSATGTTDDWAYVGVAVSELTLTATGAISASAATVSGTGSHAENPSGTGAITTAATTVSGTGAEVFTATGSVTTAATTTSGTGAEEFTATGAVTLQAATVSGTGAEVFTATGDITHPAVTVAGTGDHTGGTPQPSGTGDITTAATTASGTGELGLTATGAVTHQATTVSGTGALELTGTGAVALAALTASGTGALVITGSGAIAISTTTVAGDGLHIQNATGTGAITLPATTVSGSGLGGATGGRGGRVAIPPIRRQQLAEDEDLIGDLWFEDI